MADTCPTCGAAVRVVGSDEGTMHYEPARSEERGPLGDEMPPLWEGPVHFHMKSAEAPLQIGAKIHRGPAEEQREARYEALIRADQTEEIVACLRELEVGPRQAVTIQAAIDAIVARFSEQEQPG